jgi:flavin reductase (DIM6/NTAB) family NADH-FMN oxidoreductase RutF
MPIEQDFFRQVMGHFATGVTIVTTQTSEGLAGLTVNSFASVSLDPCLVLICIDQKSHTLPFLRSSRSFAVNFLTTEQEDLSRCFATASIERNEYFCHAPYHTAVTGSPILEDILAFVDARIVAEYPGGDHAIFLGRVVAMGAHGKVLSLEDEGKGHNLTTGHDGASNNTHAPLTTEEKEPLAYYKGKYRHLSGDYLTPSLATRYEKEYR